MSDTVGYSKKPLVAKLGYVAGDRVCVIEPPDWFPEELALAGIIPTDDRACDWLHGFFIDQAALQAFLKDASLPDINKGLWVSWPKKTSGVITDLTEQTFRNLILPLGWVDTKVVAIDEVWSGLKFLRRKEV